MRPRERAPVPPVIPYVVAVRAKFVRKLRLGGQEDREPGVPDYPVPEIEFGYSPFELELTHKKHPDEVCLDFYDTAMETTSSELNITWFKHDDPTPIAMDGNKMKLNFDVTHGMLYNGLSACLRMFDEKEKHMMANVHGDPVWRCVAGLELALYFSTTMDLEGQQEVMSMFSTAIKGFRVSQCRMIMVPLPISGAYSLYVYDRAQNCAVLSAVDCWAQHDGKCSDR